MRAPRVGFIAFSLAAAMLSSPATGTIAQALCCARAQSCPIVESCPASGSCAESGSCEPHGACRPNAPNAPCAPDPERCPLLQTAPVEPARSRMDTAPDAVAFALAPAVLPAPFTASSILVPAGARARHARSLPTYLELRHLLL